MTRSWRRPVATTAMVAVLIVSGCGGSGSTVDPSSTPAQPGDAAVQFTECMRDNGVDLPDPPPGADTVELPAAAKADPDTDAAVKACQHLLSEGAAKDLSDPEAQDKAVRLARCLREHGIDVPDPQPGQPLELDVDASDPGTMRTIQECRDAVSGSDG